MPFSELPRPLLVRSILRELGRSSDILQRGQTGLELTASRVADAVEAAVDIFAGFDDPQPMHSAILDRTFEGLEEIRAAAGAPSSPEDLDQPAVAPLPRDPVRFPQPVNNLAPEDRQKPSLIVLPGTKEADRVMKDREIAPIRPRRITGPEPSEGEAASWSWEELYSVATLRTPDSIKVKPPGVMEEIQLDRTIMANQAAGVIKVSYAAASQRDSVPTVYGATADQAMNIPIEASKSFSVYDSRSLDFDDAVGEIKDRARLAYTPKKKGIVSATRITNQSLEGLFAEIQRTPSGKATPSGSAFQAGNSDSV